MSEPLLIAILSVLIPGLVSILLFQFQTWRERPKDQATILKDGAEISKIHGETWEKLVEELREEVERQKQERKEIEAELTKRIEELQHEIETSARDCKDAIEMQRQLHLSVVEGLRSELEKIKRENQFLRDQNAALVEIVNSQAAKLQALQNENDIFKAELSKLKKDTGELKDGTKR